MSKARIIASTLSLLIVVAAIAYLQFKKPQTGGQRPVEIKSAATLAEKTDKAARYPLAKEITTPDGFINTEKIGVQEFIGKKIVLIDFWTYSCINCQRTTPYLNAWYEKYKDQGLVIIGVHTPEFEFEKKYENVRAAVEKFSIHYPVVLDNDYSTWQAYGNRYWPRKYLIDIDGFIVYDHIGEGGYNETEKKIQELLEERKVALGMDEKISQDIARPAGVIPVDSTSPLSPEIYFGAGRNAYLENGTPSTIGLQNLSEPGNIKTNGLYLSGSWNFQDEFAESKSAPAKIILRYQAKNVYFVAGSKNGTKIKVIQDGKAITETIVKEHKLYPLIQDEDYGEHTLELIIDSQGLEAYTFTFG